MATDRPRRLTALRFGYRGRFGFFLRAEAARAGFSYPVPPRTALLGLCAGILGLPKDTLGEVLGESMIAVRGGPPATHWHKGNHRKDPPAPLPYEVTRRTRDEAKEERNTQLNQEWLIAPAYEVLAVLPEPHHAELARRIAEGTSHFTPCMGLSEMLATIEPLGEEHLVAVDEGVYPLGSVVGAAAATVDAAAVVREGLQVIGLSMPRTVTSERRFEHAQYFVERRGRPIPCRTAAAWRGQSGLVTFL